MSLGRLYRTQPGRWLGSATQLQGRRSAARFYSNWPRSGLPLSSGPGSRCRIAGTCHLVAGSWQRHFGTRTLSTYSAPNGGMTRAEHARGRGRGGGPSWIATWAHENTGWRASCAASPDGAGARSGEADVQDEVPEPQVEYSAAGPMHHGCQQDDSQDYDDHPEEKHNDAGDGIPGYSSRSSHGHQLPAAARLIRRVFTGDEVLTR